MNQILAAAVAELNRLGHTPLAQLVAAVADTGDTAPPSPWSNGMSQPDAMGRVRLRAVVESPDVPEELRNTLFFVREAASSFPLNDLQRFQIEQNCGGTYAVPGSIHAFSDRSGARVASEYGQRVETSWLGTARTVITMERTLGDTLAFQANVSLTLATAKFLAHWRLQNTGR